MSGLRCAVLYPEEYSPADSSRLKTLLTEFSKEVEETRKGRYFEIVLQNTVISIRAARTIEEKWDWEDLLLEHNLSFEEYPTVITLESGIDSSRLREVLGAISERIVQEFNGIDWGTVS